MIRQFKYRDITWIDATNPSKEELSSLVRDFNIHSLVENELSEPSKRSHVDPYENYIYLVLQFPSCRFCFGKEKDSDIKNDTQEIDFIAGKDFLITIHYEPIQALEEFGQIFEANLKNVTDKDIHTGYLLFEILIQMYRSLDTALVFLSDELKRAERNIFEGKEREMVVVLSKINHELLDSAWSLQAHEEVLVALENAGGEFFGKNFRIYLKRVTNIERRIFSALTNLRDTYTELRTTNDSLLTIKTNEIMKVLTIMAFTTFPLTVFTSTFGMNTVNNPILGMPYDFWIIVGIMLAAVATMFTFFRYKRWF